ncbi:hypothetical protein ACJJTC_014959 [Scirpophaga incertulas]
MIDSPCPSVLLKIVPLTVRGPGGAGVHAHALLDDGATVTLITSDIADQLGLRGKPITMRARDAWNSELDNCHLQGGPYITKSLLGWSVHGRLKKSALISLINCTDFNKNIEECTDVVVNCYSLFTIQSDSPSSSTDTPITPECKFYNDNQLHDLDSKYFTLESMGICSKPRQNPEELRADEILNETSTLTNGT